MSWLNLSLVFSRLGVNFLPKHWLLNFPKEILDRSRILFPIPGTSVVISLRVSTRGFTTIMSVLMSILLPTPSHGMSSFVVNRWFYRLRKKRLGTMFFFCNIPLCYPFFLVCSSLYLTFFSLPVSLLFILVYFHYYVKIYLVPLNVRCSTRL